MQYTVGPSSSYLPDVFESPLDSNCCNLKRINPKAIYYMVIALQSISIRTNRKLREKKQYFY